MYVIALQVFSLFFFNMFFGLVYLFIYIFTTYLIVDRLTYSRLLSICFSIYISYSHIYNLFNYS